MLRASTSSKMMEMRFVVMAVLGVVGLGCSSSTQGVYRPVQAAPPPKDDGKPAEGGRGGSEHSAALEQLKIGAADGRTDKQNSMRVPLPDAPNWTRVRFWGVPSLVGFRYGKDHHAIVAAFITHVDDNSVQGACTKSFEAFANPMVETFDVDIKREPPIAVMWNKVPNEKTVAPQPIDIDAVFAKTATLASRESYAAAYATYPAWKGACLVVGIAIPARDDETRALQVRERFVKDVLPNVEVLTKDEPKERY
jgi:hypothetical protein